MRVSIVTVSRNAVATIGDTLASVAAQSHPEREHIVVDGASDDGTLDVIERHRAGLARVVSEPDDGIYDAMNKGIRLATGAVVGTLNADDVYADEDVLARVVSVFEDRSVEACYGDLVYVSRDDPARVIRYWTSRPYEPGLFEGGWIPAHPTFFVRREVYQKHGLFDLRYRLQSDFELTMRMLRVHGIRARYLPGVMVRMRLGGTTNRSLGNIVRGNIESYRAVRQHGLGVDPLSFFLRKFARRIPQFFRRPPPG